jgi:hypothetical protein
MLGQLPWAPAAGVVALPEGAVVEVEPESDVLLEEEPEVSLVCA